MQYEKVDVSTSESEETESSDDQESVRVEVKKRKIENSSSSFGNGMHISSSGKCPTIKKKRNPAPRQPKPPTRSPVSLKITINKRTFTYFINFFSCR